MLITAICPTYNRASWISLAIQSFLAQTFTDSELVILDNGSDYTESLIPVHPRIRYEKVPGPRLRTGAIRNLCCERAQGEVICHFDDDDWSSPERIASQIEQMKQSGKPFIGYHRISFWNAAQDSKPPKDRAHQYLGDQPYACGTSQMYLKSYWEKNRFQNSSIGEDSDFSTRAKAAGQLASFDGCQMIVARAHSDSTCPAPLGQNQFPKVPLAEIPKGFLKAMGVEI